MKNYIRKILASYASIFALVNVSWIISVFYLMSNSPQQMRVFSLQAFLIWLVFFVLGMTAAFFVARPVQEGLDRLSLGTITNEELLGVGRKNRIIPIPMLGILIVMIILDALVTCAVFRNQGVGPLALNGVLITFITGAFGLFVFLTGILYVVNSSVHHLIYSTCRERGIRFDERGLSVGGKIVIAFISVGIWIVSWLLVAGFYSGIDRIQKTSPQDILALQDNAIREIRALRGQGLTVQDLAPFVDRMASSGVGTAFLADTRGKMLYNPKGIELFNQGWQDIDDEIRTGLAGNRPGSVYENLNERIVCYIPVSQDIVLGTVIDVMSKFGSLKQYITVNLIMVLIAFSLVIVDTTALMFTVMRPLRGILKNLKNLSSGEGDLTRRLEVQSADEMGELATMFNDFVDNLEGIVTSVKHTASDVNEAAREVHSSSYGLSSSLQSQAASVQEVAATIEEMTASIKQNASFADEGRNRSRAMVQMADASNAAMKQLVKAMDDISTSSKKIGDIIVTVNEVAFQTNLLALNAAVEAARAGEHGKGFAIVAQEVRALAQRSAEAAREIRQLIVDTVDKITAGDEMAKKTGESINAIINEINFLSEAMEEVATASIEQSNGAGELNKNISEIDTMNQQNASTVVELADNAENMTTQAGELSTIVQRFKVSEA